MKVTGLETVRLAGHPQMLWVQVHTDEGITGLGETCLGPATVEAHVHETIAPYCVSVQPMSFCNVGAKMPSTWRSM